MASATVFSPHIAAAPAFVPRTTARGHPLLAPPRAALVQRSMRHREIASPVARPAREIASRLRRNVARHELPSSALGAVLATPHLAAARAASEAHAVMQAAAARQPAETPSVSPPAPAINVEALTGMVIQQIDRRLVAYRERMGRG
jgi:hypothetical protein